MATATALKSSPLQPDDWIRAAFARLSTEGIESVRIELLARDLGVSKGSFYWHFQDREELLAKMLDRWEGDETTWLDDTVVTPQAAARWARGLAAMSVWLRAFPASRKNAPRMSPAFCATSVSRRKLRNRGLRSPCWCISAGWDAPRAISSSKFPAAASASSSPI